MVLVMRSEKEFNKENVKAVLNDPEKLSSLRFRAVGRGATMGTIDAMTAGLAGAVSSQDASAAIPLLDTAESLGPAPGSLEARLESGDITLEERKLLRQQALSNMIKSRN